MGGEFTYQPKSDPNTVLTTTAMSWLPGNWGTSARRGHVQDALLAECVENQLVGLIDAGGPNGNRKTPGEPSEVSFWGKYWMMKPPNTPGIAGYFSTRTAKNDTYASEGLGLASATTPRGCSHAAVKSFQTQASIWLRPQQKSKISPVVMNSFQNQQGKNNIFLSKWRQELCVASSFLLLSSAISLSCQARMGDPRAACF